MKGRTWMLETPFKAGNGNARETTARRARERVPPNPAAAGTYPSRTYPSRPIRAGPIRVGLLSESDLSEPHSRAAGDRRAAQSESHQSASRWRTGGPAPPQTPSAAWAGPARELWAGRPGRPGELPELRDAHGAPLRPGRQAGGPVGPAGPGRRGRLQSMRTARPLSSPSGRRADLYRPCPVCLGPRAGSDSDRQ